MVPFLLGELESHHRGWREFFDRNGDPERSGAGGGPVVELATGNTNIATVPTSVIPDHSSAFWSTTSVLGSAIWTSAGHLRPPTRSQTPASFRDSFRGAGGSSR